jgi:hypothetical protein
MKTGVLLALLGLMAMDVATAASFGRPQRVTLARNSTATVAIGDINGDGLQDLAATSIVPDWTHELALFTQRPGGTLSAPLKLPLPEAVGFTWSSAFVDLDHDGTEELLVGSPHDGFKLVRMAGNGTLSVVDHAGLFTGCSFIATGDLDSDGNVDVVCHNWSVTIGLYYGDGHGGFRSKVRMPSPAGPWDGQDFKRVRIADVTGDGHPDLVMTASGVSSFFVAPNDGHGAFPYAIAYTHPWTALPVWPAAIEVIDLDGDGADEILTANPYNSPGAAVGVYRRGAGGYYDLSESVPIYQGSTALLAGDVGDDGDLDLVAGHFGFNQISVLHIAAGALASQERYDLPGFGQHLQGQDIIGHTNSLALGDLNGDGCNDLAGATYSGILLLPGCRPFVKRVPVSDFDGDGVGDILWRIDETGENSLWHFGDVGAWHQCLSTIGPCPRPLGRPWTPQAVGDFDGDGTSDLMWRNRTTGVNEVWDRIFYPRSIAGVTSRDWQVVGAGDFDGDDRSDLLWRNSRTGANAIWKSANATTQQPTQSVSDVRWQVVGVGDFNGDRRSDILWRHSTSGANAIWRSGRFDIQQPVTGVTNLQWKVAGIGDFNGDGKDDVAWRNASSGANAIWLSGNSAAQQAVATVTNRAWNIAAVADYNGDGRSDLMWHNTSTGANVIWRSARSTTQQAVAQTNPSAQAVR